MEPLVLFAGFVTIWAQLNNYGINSEKYPHLKNVRVRRGIDPQPSTTQNRIQDSESKIYLMKGDSIIIKSIYSGVTQKRNKRSYYNGNNYNNGYNGKNYSNGYNVYNGNNYSNGYNNYEGNYKNNVSNLQYGYHTTERTRLASYPTNSPQVPKVSYNNGYNGNMNSYQSNGYNGNGVYRNNQPVTPNNGYNGNPNSYQSYIYNGNNHPVTPNITYGYNITQNQSNYTNHGNKYNNFKNTTFFNQSTSIYNSFKNNITVTPLNNDNDAKEKRKNITKISSFMSGINCPQFMQSYTLFGTKVCINEDDY